MNMLQSRFHKLLGAASGSAGGDDEAVEEVPAAETGGEEDEEAVLGRWREDDGEEPLPFEVEQEELEEEELVPEEEEELVPEEEEEVEPVLDGDEADQAMQDVEDGNATYCEEGGVIDEAAIDELLTSAAAEAGGGRPSGRSGPPRAFRRGNNSGGGRRLVEFDGVHVDPESTCSADLRFQTPEDAMRACEELHGGSFEAAGFGPNTIAVVPSGTSKDSTKVVVHGLPLGIEWQELKDFFKQIGQIAFVAIWPRAVSETTVTLVPGTLVGEVRYDLREHALQAVEELDGSILAGSKISLSLDAGSKDGTRIIVSGVPQGTEWQELKDHFSPIGTVGYAGIKGATGAGAGTPAASRGAKGAAASLHDAPPGKGVWVYKGGFGGGKPGFKGPGPFTAFGGGPKGSKGLGFGFDKGYGYDDGYYPAPAKGKNYGWI